MGLSPCAIFKRGTSPIIAAAIHDGHDTHPRIDRRMSLSERERLREEDPWTGEWTQVAKTQIVGLRSRFEVDLNRPREEAVYQTPSQAWGLDIWKTPPDPATVAACLREYDEFYAAVKSLLEDLVERHGRVVVYDLHSYNHRRDGADAPPADERGNPEVNIGTKTMDREYWAPIVDRFILELRTFDFHGEHLDVRENVKFGGGHFCRWIHETFPGTVCALAIEFKKFYMDEWTGEAVPHEIESIYDALQYTIPGVERALLEHAGEAV